jgi:hypothetical protein
MAEAAAPRGRGRPPRPPASEEAILDAQAFWRLKSRALVGLNSFQAIRTLAFCSVWQKAGRAVAGVVASGYCGRGTVFNRLRECRAAGFDPGRVEFADGGERWEDMEGDLLRHLKDEFVEDSIRRAKRPVLIRAVTRRARPHPDLFEDTRL